MTVLTARSSGFQVYDATIARRLSRRYRRCIEIPRDWLALQAADAPPAVRGYGLTMSDRAASSTAMVTRSRAPVTVEYSIQ